MSRKFKSRSHKLVELACNEKENDENNLIHSHVRYPSAPVIYDNFSDLSHNESSESRSKYNSLNNFEVQTTHIPNDNNLLPLHDINRDGCLTNHHSSVSSSMESHVDLAAQKYILEYDLQLSATSVFEKNCIDESNVFMDTRQECEKNSEITFIPTSIADDDLVLFNIDEQVIITYPSKNNTEQPLTNYSDTFGPDLSNTFNENSDSAAKLSQHVSSVTPYCDNTDIIDIAPRFLIDHQDLEHNMLADDENNVAMINANGCSSNTIPKTTTNQLDCSTSSSTQNLPEHVQIIAKHAEQALTPMTIPTSVDRGNDIEISTVNLKKKRIRDKKIRLDIDRENHKLLPPCNDKCRQKCKDKISEEGRQSIWKSFWSIDLQRRRDFITHSVIKDKTKWKTRKVSMRTSTLKYNLNKQQVCKTFYLHTLGYRHDRIVRNVLRANHENGIQPGNMDCQIAAAPDKRGKHTPKNARGEVYKLKVKEYIEKYRPTKTHYTLKNAPNKRYLPIGCTFAHIFKKFNQDQTKSNEQTCSWSYFHNIISEMNLSSCTPAQDKCVKCVNHHTKHPDEEHSCDSCDCSNCSAFPEHKKCYQLSRRHMKIDEEEARNSNGKKEVFTVDMQKVLLMPKIDIKEYFFLRKLVLFNETFASPGVGKPAYCLLWHEGESGRKAFNIATAFVIFLEKFARDFEHISIYCDNCSSQNKNRILFSSLVRYINNKNVTLKCLKLEYLEPGHTYMAADQVHGAITKKLSKVPLVCDINDFSCQIKESRCKTDTLYFEHESVYLFENETKAGFPKDYNISNLKIVEFRRGSSMVFAKKEYNEEEYKTLNVFSAKLTKFLNKTIKNGFIVDTFESVKKQSEPRGISQEKMNDLKKMLPSIPNNRHGFFLNLKINNNVEDLCSNLDTDV